MLYKNIGTHIKTRSESEDTKKKNLNFNLDI